MSNKIMKSEIYRNEINQVRVYKLLGIYIDDQFNYKYHVENIINKLLKSLYMLPMLSRIVQNIYRIPYTLYNK